MSTVLEIYAICTKKPKKISHSEVREFEPLADYASKIGQNSPDFHAEGDSWRKVAKAAAEHSFFHWDLEFPDIFYGPDGRRKENPGFDAVVGNPPYGAKMSKLEREYYKLAFSDVGSTDTAQLMIGMVKRLLSRYGQNGFVVPKALTFASNWSNTRESLTRGLTVLIDCKKVWDEVKLEQVVYIYQNNATNKFYHTGCRTQHEIVVDTKVDKNKCSMFGLLLCGITQEEILLGQKIYERSEKLGKYVKNRRGCMLQNKLKERGAHKVLGGAQIQRYRVVEGSKGYLETADMDDKSKVMKNAILAQRIVSHIKNPTDHLKITATIPTRIEFVILDTISHIIVDGLNPYYVLGLLNSKITNWYAYRFIFGKAIRTMQFDNPTTDRIPIAIKQEELVVQRVKELIRVCNESSKAQTKDTTMLNENALNRLFYEAFGLDDDEIEMVENTTPS